MPFNVGPMELVIVLVIALVVLGPKRLPDAGKAVGRSLREFKGAISGETSDDPDGMFEPIAAPVGALSAPSPAHGSEAGTP